MSGRLDGIHVTLERFSSDVSVVGMSFNTLGIEERKAIKQKAQELKFYCKEGPPNGEFFNLPKDDEEGLVTVSKYELSNERVSLGTKSLFVWESARMEEISAHFKAIGGLFKLPKLIPTQYSTPPASTSDASSQVTPSMNLKNPILDNKEAKLIVEIVKKILLEYYQNVADERGMNCSDLGGKLQWTDKYKTKYGPLKKFLENFPEFKFMSQGTTAYVSLVEVPATLLRTIQLKDGSLVPIVTKELRFPFPDFFNKDEGGVEGLNDPDPMKNENDKLKEKLDIRKYLSFDENYQPIFSSNPLEPSSLPKSEGPQFSPEYDLETLLGILPPKIRSSFLGIETDNLIEIVMDLGRIPAVRLRNLNEAKGELTVPLGNQAITREDLEYITGSNKDNNSNQSKVTEFGSDNRAGIDSTLHRVSRIVNRNKGLVGLTCRFGRAVSGVVDLMMQDLICPSNLSSMLILGSPGTGKTTLLRDISRVLADRHKLRVIIVDTSNELGGDGDIPHPGIGSARRLQVPERSLQHQLMVEAVCNHMPEVIIVDEITNHDEADAAQTIAQRGIHIIATAHGSFSGFVKNPILCGLLGGTQPVTMGDQRAKQNYGGKKILLERVGHPTFSVCVELESLSTIAVYNNTAHAVDTLLASNVCISQIRKRSQDGTQTSHKLVHINAF